VLQLQDGSKHNSNSFANFVWQMLLFVNSQNDIGREQKGHLQVFGNFDLAKTKFYSEDQQRSIRLSDCVTTHEAYRVHARAQITSLNSSLFCS
jgi:hypothetical protein